MTIPDIEQKHFFEDRFSDKHNTVFYSFCRDITLGECLCGEIFVARTEHAFGGERAIKIYWRAHAKGLSANKRKRGIKE
jgi:hypothetical protein